jgi:hypothetical protein
MIGIQRTNPTLITSQKYRPTRAGESLLDQAQRRPDQQRVHRAQQKAAQQPKRRGHRPGHQHRHGKQHEGDGDDPSPREGARGLAEGLAVQGQRRPHDIGHTVL